ncbi:hypothetical protein Dda_2098 [Drechslerella dactyloides]|uniref:Uncharacterized protein n=1 Tax=Drechslerella dactyloides TaxID=74499 RepID=A0AAD6J2W6_DREDA|nr:hypothetical protein Dda_2098 [Drechslerella dactyloides]
MKASIAAMIFAAMVALASMMRAGEATGTSTSSVPRPSALLPPGSITKRVYAVERLEVHTPRNVTIVKARLAQQLGNITQTSILGATATSQASYTAAVDDNKGPAGYIWFLSIFHGRWFRLWGFADPRAYVPKEMTQYTIGNPLVLLTFARFTIDAFLNAPIRILVYDTVEGGTTIVWDRPCTQLVLPGAPAAAYTTCRLLDDQISMLVQFIAYGA